MRHYQTVRARLLKTLALILLPACGSGTVEPGCSLFPRPALKLFAKDSVTNRFIASGATLTARDSTVRYQSTYFDRNRPDLDSMPMSILAGAAGRWTLTLTKPGYVTWTRQFTVVLDGCRDLDPTTITARMQPVP